MWLDWPDVLINLDSIQLVVASDKKEGPYRIVLVTEKDEEEKAGGHIREFECEGDMKEEFHRIRKILCGMK